MDHKQATSHLCLEEAYKSCEVVFVLPTVTLKVAVDGSIACLTHNTLFTTEVMGAINMFIVW